MERKMNKNASEIEEINYSSKIHLSYAFGGFIVNFITSAFIVRTIYYYENELFLSITLVGIAFLIFGVWNMINDPILGFLCDRKTRLTERWGRRFPWFIAGAFIYSFTYLLIFIVPFRDQLGMFIWLLITLLLYELFYSLWQINWLSLYPDKFRSQKERTKVSSFGAIAAQFGVALGIIIPPLFITYGNINSYIVAAFILMIINLFSVVLVIPGMREDKELISREIRIIEQQNQKDSFWSILKFAVKQKNFIAYNLFYIGHQVFMILVLSSLPFWTIYILRARDPNIELILAVSFLFGALLSIPLWFKVGRKLGNRKGFMIGSLLAVILSIPMLFISDFLTTVIMIFFLSIAIGAITTLMYPCLSDTIDEMVLQSGKRTEGTYSGIRTFAGRSAIVIQAIVFAVVHELTGYKAGASTQTPLALWGIRVIMVLIPMIFYLVGFLLMWLVYDLKPEKVRDIKILLKERGL
ncbi:MAG: MFS transporter [Promethearchaeota archaeon]|nr:MAG: MFS transporter [Candidatus Lokiarchaeota archaeon]